MKTLIEIYKNQFNGLNLLQKIAFNFLLIVFVIGLIGLILNMYNNGIRL